MIYLPVRLNKDFKSHVSSVGRAVIGRKYDLLNRTNTNYKWPSKSKEIARTR